MPKCTFCGEDIRKGTGKMFVFTDGRISYFCSMKCEKNMLKLKRDPKVITWTKRYQDFKRTAGKGAAQEAPKEPKKEAKHKDEKQKGAK